MATYTLGELAARFGLELKGEAAATIHGICTLSPGRPAHLSFLAGAKYRSQLAGTQSGAVIVGRRDAAALSGNGLVAADPYAAFARIAALFDPDREFSPGLHPKASVDDAASIGAGAWIGPMAVVEAGAQIGAGAFVGPGCHIGRDARIGAGSRLVANVHVGARVKLGLRCHVQPGAVIGGRGFGNAPTAQGWVEVPQLGSVIVGDDVEIGANTTIDRGAIEDTVIEDGVKLDNQIQIAHNCRIGAHTAIAGCAGIAGSTHIGARCMIGGAAVIAGHVKIGDDVVILGMSMVTKSLPEKGVYGSGWPVEDARTWRRQVGRLRRLDRTEQRLAAVERHLGITAAKAEGGDEQDDI